MAILTFDPIAARSPRRWLVASLVLNAFLAALALALFFQPFSAKPTPPDRSIATRFEQLALSLPQADAQKLRAQFSSKLAAIDAARQGYRAALETTGRALRAEPFDIDAAHRTIAAAGAERVKLDAAIGDVLVSAAAEMTPEGRRKLADYRTAAAKGR